MWISLGLWPAGVSSSLCHLVSWLSCHHSLRSLSSTCTFQALKVNPLTTSLVSAPFSYTGLGHFVLILHWPLRLRVTLTVFSSFPSEDLGSTQRVSECPEASPIRLSEYLLFRPFQRLRPWLGYCTGLPKSPCEGLPSAPGLPHFCHSTPAYFLHSTFLGLSCMFICLFHL